MVQRDLILGLGLAAFVVLLVSAYGLRGTLGRTGLPLLGLIFVAGFVLIRAAGFHHVDVLLQDRFAATTVNWLFEVPGPVLVSVSAIWLLARRKRYPTS